MTQAPGTTATSFSIIGHWAQGREPVGSDMHLYPLPPWKRGSATFPGLVHCPEPLTAGNISQPLPDSSVHQGPSHSKFPSGTCSVSPRRENRQTYRYAHMQERRNVMLRQEEGGALGQAGASSIQVQGLVQALPVPTYLKYEKAEAQCVPHTEEMGIPLPSEI